FEGTSRTGVACYQSPDTNWYRINLIPPFGILLHFKITSLLAFLLSTFGMGSVTFNLEH
ncbi:hypothetical protein CRM22_001170, partial [Opisthorchis felineus]